MKRTEIYVATQSNLKIALPNCYIPIEVGNNPEIREYMCDSIYDNIAYKNKYYCELTALYWLWRNSQADIVGLMHYRRYLAQSERTKEKCKPMSELEIKRGLWFHDMILPQKLELFKTVEEQYVSSPGHYEEDYHLCRDIVLSVYPEYENSFETISMQSKLHICNIFISKKQLIDEYCEWLFTILFTLEKEMKKQKNFEHNQRVFGYLAERLFNVWLYQNKVNVLEKTLILTQKQKYIKK